MNELNVKQYDPITDTIEIEGTKYAGALFRELGCNFPSMVGQILKVYLKKDGVVTVKRIDRPRTENEPPDDMQMMVVFSPTFRKSFLAKKRFVFMDITMGFARETNHHELMPMLWTKCEEFNHDADGGEDGDK